MRSVEIMQCGICKAFHFETTGSCPECQSHRIHQLIAEIGDYAAALRQSAQRLRKKAEEMEREASALEASMAAANDSPENVTAIGADYRATVDLEHSGLMRRSA